jgi:hypothetical protein
MHRTMLWLLFAALFLFGLAGCQESPLKSSVLRLKEACASVDPACGKGATERDQVEEATGLLAQIQGLCSGLETGSVTCRQRLQDLAGVMGQVGMLAGSWESVAPYNYKAKIVEKVQVATSGTRYWVGAKDNKGGIYVSQDNNNLVCASADIVPAGVNVTDFLEATNGTPGETREDLLCEKLYPGFPLCLGTYRSMCVSSGWREKDRWLMNTKADEACIRAFEWRTKDESKAELFRGQLKKYITGMAVQLETCGLQPSPQGEGRMILECGSEQVPVFKDEVRRM